MTQPPLHERIRMDVEKLILSGRWPPGSRIPVEHELERRYGCSRMTVSKALGALAQSGLIERRKRAGSFVSRPPVHSAVLTIPDIQTEIEQRGDPYRCEVIASRIERGRRRQPLAQRIAGARETLWLRCVHRAGAVPFAFEERVISLDAVPGARSVDFGAESPGRWLLGHIPWTQAEHRISAVGADRALASLLAVAPGTPCLVLERQTWRDAQGITAVRQVFPAQLFDLVARFRPGPAAAQEPWAAAAAMHRRTGLPPEAAPARPPVRSTHRRASGRRRSDPSPVRSATAR